MTARLLWGNVLIRPIHVTRKTKAGIELPENAVEKTDTIRGSVISVGKASLAFDGSLIPMEVQPGDIVDFIRYEARSIVIDNEKLFIVDQRQIVAVLFD
jgi:chaperonin GroES